MAKIKLLSATFLSFGLLTPNAYSENLEEVFAKVMSTNPVILASKNNVDVALENVRQERADFMPTITANGSYTDTKREFDTGVETDTSPKSAGVTLSQTLFAGGGEVYSYKAAKALYDQAQYSYDASVQNVLNSTVEAYINVLTAQDVLNLQINQVKLLTEQLKLTNARFEQGEVTKTDVKQAEARLALAQAERIQSQGDFRTARTVLNNLVGDDVKTLIWPKIMFNLPTDYSVELREQVLASHPEVLASKAIYNSGKYTVKASRSTYFPQVSAVASFTYNRDTATFTDNRDTATGDYEDKSVGVQVSLPLFAGGRNVSQVRESIATREQYRQNFDQVRRDINQNLVDTIELYNTAVASLKAYKEAESAAVVAEKGVENEQLLGERTVLDLLDARQELLEARVNVAVARGAVISRAFGLLRALGELDETDASAPTL